MATASSTSQRYTWTFPGAPVRVSVHLEVIRTLEEDLAQAAVRGSAARGVLLGRTGTGKGTEITGFVPVSNDPNAISTALSSLRNATDIVPVGFYRTQTEESLRLGDTDFEIAREHFSNPAHVFLVIHLSKVGADRATFFFWDNDQIHRDFAFLEFPFDAAQLAARESLRAGNGKKRQAEPEPSAPKNAAELPHPSAEPPQRRAVAVRRRWIPVALLGIVLVGLLAASVPFLKLRSAPTVIAKPVQVAVEEPKLGLKFEHQGNDLAVTWDRDAVVRYGAAAGLLSIRDGANEKVIGLNAQQVRSANLLISPESDQVQIQLTFLLPDQKAVSEAAIAILSSHGPATAVVESVPIPAKPVPAERFVDRTPKRVAERRFIAPAKRNTADRVVLEEPPAVNLHASTSPGLPYLGQTSPIVPLPGQNRTAAAPPASSPVTQPANTSSAPAKFDTDVKPVEFVSGNKPAYPAVAHQARVQGTVVLDAQIGIDGRVRQVTIVSGHQMLREAAVKAVREWVFRPARINGKPVEGPTRVEVKFHGNW